MDSSEAARVFLAENTLLHINMLEILRRGSGDILYAGPDGVLLRDRQSEAYFMASAGAESDGRLLDLLPGDTGLFVGHHLRYKGEAARRFRLREEQICYQAAWMRPELPAAPEISGTLCLLDRSHAAYVYEHYSHPFGGVAYVEKVIERGMVGAFVDGVLAGFAGFHDEGSIGLLEVLPEYRRRGLGEALLCAAVRLALERGQYAFGQVFTDNRPSLALQRKVGMTVSEDILYWLF